MRGRRFTGYVVAAVGLSWLAVTAARAGSSVPGSNPWLITADLIVGIAFVIAGVVAPGPILIRGLVIGVGALWLLGSWLPRTGLWHQALLAVVLTVFPVGKPSNRVHWLLIGLTVPVGLGLVAQPVVAVLFAAIAITAVVAPGAHRAGAAYVAVSAIGLAFFLAGSWTYSRIEPAAFDPRLALLLYEILLVAVAIGSSMAIRFWIAGRAKLTDLVLSDDGPAGLDGFTSVLAGALQDPLLRIYLWHDDDTGYRTDSDERATPRRWLEVMLDDEPIAAVSSNSPALDDPSTLEAVSTAVRLAVRNQQLEERLQLQLVNLEAARARLLAAVDRQRQGTATRLRGDVVTILRRARAELEGIEEDVGESAATEALAVACDELLRAEDEVAALVAGVPPAVLGNGQLGNVIADLAERSSVPVTVAASVEAAADAETETALFYVCSEAVTNAVKHAAATRIHIALMGDRDAVTLRVTDDGRGGADLSGSGLQGLSDRLAARGGRLLVESPPGAGTAVTATLPR